MKTADGTDLGMPTWPQSFWGFPTVTVHCPWWSSSIEASIETKWRPPTDLRCGSAALGNVLTEMRPPFRSETWITFNATVWWDSGFEAKTPNIWVCVWKRGYFLSPIPKDYHYFPIKKTALGIHHFACILGNGSFFLYPILGAPWKMGRCQLAGRYLDREIPTSNITYVQIRRDESTERPFCTRWCLQL